jgi:hypothetical protein
MLVKGLAKRAAQTGTIEGRGDFCVGAIWRHFVYRQTASSGVLRDRSRGAARFKARLVTTPERQ